MTSSSSLRSGADSADAGQPREDGGRTKLTKSAVVDRALALADAAGLDALTIRKLAQELNVTPMALYWHFRSKDELLDGLADRVWSEIDVDVDPEVPWPDQLRFMLESLVRVLRAHPAAPELLMFREQLTDSALIVTEVALEVLRGAGFDPQEASEIAGSGLWTAIMLVMSENGIKAVGRDEREEVQRKKQIVLATLPPAKFPRVVECASPLTEWMEPEFHYEFGIRLWIAGVEAMGAKLSGQVEAS